MKRTKIFDVNVEISNKDKIKGPLTCFGKTYITKGFLNSKDLDSNAKKFILKHERYHQLTHGRKLFLALSIGIFIISFCVDTFIGLETIFISSILSLLVSIFSVILLSFGISYENEIQADLFASKELGRNNAVIAINTIQKSKLGQKLDKSIFHRMTHPTLEQRLNLIKSI